MKDVITLLKHTPKWKIFLRRPFHLLKKLFNLYEWFQGWKMGNSKLKTDSWSCNLLIQEKIVERNTYSFLTSWDSKSPKLITLEVFNTSTLALIKGILGETLALNTILKTYLKKHFLLLVGDHGLVLHFRVQYLSNNGIDPNSFFFPLLC